jgi:hypothetical protein
MRPVLIVLALVSGMSRMLAAQSGRWGLTAEIGLSWFQGSARRDSAGIADDLHPSPSRSVALRVDRRGRRVGLALTALYEQTGLQDAADEVSITINDVAKLYSIRPELWGRVLTLKAVTVEAHGGVSLDYWQFAGMPNRIKAGAIGGLTLVAPIGGAFALRVRWEGSVSGSVINAGELAPSFELRRSFHSRLGFGIRLGL